MCFKVEYMEIDERWFGFKSSESDDSDKSYEFESESDDSDKSDEFESDSESLESDDIMNGDVS